MKVSLRLAGLGILLLPTLFICLLPARTFARAGALDTSFNPGSGINTAQVISVALQVGGKAFIGGDFTTYNGVARNGVARLNLDGSLDSSFTSDLSATSVVRSVLVQPDGKVVVSGVDPALKGFSIRFDFSGNRDSSYQNASLANSVIRTSVFQPDGTILVGGDFSQVSGMKCLGIARLRPNGVLDSGFTAAAGGNAPYVYSLARQATAANPGGILVGGVFTSFNNAPHGGIVRLTADGALDAGFTAAGISGGSSPGVYCIAVQAADNKILICGQFTGVNGVSCNNLARFNSDGSLDTSFNVGGSGSNGIVQTVAVQPDGKILIGGNFSYYNGVECDGFARLNPDGNLDPDFTFAGFDSNPNAMVLQLDGKIVICGTFTKVSGTSRRGVVRLNGDSPAITSAASAGGQVGQPFNYQINATFAPTSYSAIGLPSGLSLNTSTGLISGTTMVAGSYPVTVSAANSSGTGSANLTITILSPAPAITSPASASGQIGLPFNYQIIASYSPTSYNAAGLPPGLSINTTTGLINGTPTQAGNFSVDLSATNAGGVGIATLTLAFTTEPPPPLPTITSAASGSAQVSQPYSYIITATNNPTSFAATALPPGLSLNPSNGLISGTPSQVGQFSVAISAANAYGSGPVATLTLSVAPPPDNITGFNILSPPSNSTFVRTETLYPYVQVQSNPGTLKQVDLFADDASGSPIFLGSSAAGLFRVGWMPPHAGAFTLRAVATDILGSSKTATLPIAVAEPPSANPAPDVKLLEGLDGKQFAPGSTVSLLADVGTSDDPLQSVAFYANGQQIARFDAASATNSYSPAQHPATRSTEANSPAKPVTRAEGSGAVRSFPPVSYTVPASGQQVAITVAARTQSGFTSNGLGAILTPFQSAFDSLLSSQITDPAPDANGNVTLPARTRARATVSPANPNAPINQMEFFVNASKVGQSAQGPYSFDLPPMEPGTYTLTALATNSGIPLSKQSAPLTVTVVETAPDISVSADAPTISRSAGEAATITFTRNGGDASQDIKVAYKVTGALVGGADYAALKGTKKIKAGKTSAALKIVPLQGGASGKLKVVVQPGEGYNVGSPAKAKVVITD